MVTGDPRIRANRDTVRQRSLSDRFRKDRFLLLIALPGVLALILFQYLPIAGNIIAFQDFQPFLGIGGSPWVGLDNFAAIVRNSEPFLNALANTLIITAIQVIFVFPLPIALAILLNSLAGEKLKRVAQSILYMPHFLSWVIVVGLFQHMFGGAGMINTFLREQDWGNIQVIGVPELFKLLVTAQVIWKDTGWGTILFLAALSRVDTELYEAAAIDGASKTRRMWHITLPALKPIIILLLILRLGDSLTVGFEQIVIQQAAVGLRASEVLDTFVYNQGILAGNWGIAAAVGLAKGVVGLALVLAANKVAHLFGEEGLYSR